MSEEIFISYKSERRAAAAHLSDILKAHGFSVWYDYGLIAGTAFADQINEKLNAAKIVIVLWCTRSVASPWVLHEALTAKHQKTYVPALIEACTLPTELAADQYIDLSRWDARPTAFEPHDIFEEIERRLNREGSADRKHIGELRNQWTKYGGKSLSGFALTAASPNRIEANAPLNDLSTAPEILTLQHPKPKAAPKDDGVMKIYQNLNRSNRGDLERFIAHFENHPVAETARHDLEALIAAEAADARLAEVTALIDGYDLARMAAYVAANRGTLEAWQVETRRQQILDGAPDDETRKQWEFEAAIALLTGKEIPHARKPYIRVLDLRAWNGDLFDALKKAAAAEKVYMDVYADSDNRRISLTTIPPLSDLSNLTSISLAGWAISDLSPSQTFAHFSGFTFSALRSATSLPSQTSPRFRGLALGTLKSATSPPLPT